MEQVHYEFFKFKIRKYDTWVGVESGAYKFKAYCIRIYSILSVRDDAAIAHAYDTPDAAIAYGG